MIIMPLTIKEEIKTKYYKEFIFDLDNLMLRASRQEFRYGNILFIKAISDMKSKYIKKVFKLIED